MPDLGTRFKGADQIPAPDLWHDVQSREPRPAPVGPSPRRRLAIAALAFVVAVAGVGLAVWAFRSGPEHRSPQPASVVENGKIAFSKGRPNGGIYLMNADGTGVERLTSDPGDSESAWSPAGSRIAFVRFQGGKSDIYVMNADGSDVTRLTTDGANSVPAWSPDGTRIAFARDVSGNQDIYVMDPDGSNVARLTNDLLLEYAPAWSPDGTRIAFSAYANPPGPVHIYSMHADGTSRVQLTQSELDDASPAWSPDGASVAFVRDSSSIFVVGPDGSGLREVVDPRGLTGGLGLTFYPTWSPDGTEIAFQSGPDGSDQRIYVVNVDGSGLHEVGSGKGSDPAWQPVPVSSTSAGPSISPTATPPVTVPEGRIAYLCGGQGIPDICVMNTDGTGRRVLSGAPPGWEPAASADGTRIAYRGYHAPFGESDYDLYVTNTDGTKVTRLTFGALPDNPAWAPDGTRIAFGTSGNGRIDAVNVDGSRLTKLTEGEAGGVDDEYPTWSPDGTRIAFARTHLGETHSQIYAMNTDGTGVTQLTSDPAGAFNPEWSPGGAKISFLQRRGGGFEPRDIYVMNADGTGVTRLTAEGDNWNAVWVEGGSEIAFLSQRDGSIGLYLMRSDGSDQRLLITDFPSEGEFDWLP